MNIQIDRLGKVSITVEKDYWSINKCYDKLVVVEKENDGGYLSRKPVPAGTSIYNREYWIKIGGYSSSGGVVLDASFTPSSVNVGVSTNITINVQVSSSATEIIVMRGSTQIGLTGSGTQHTVTDTITPENTNTIFYQITALVNGLEIGKVFSINVNKAILSDLSWRRNNQVITVDSAIIGEAYNQPVIYPNNTIVTYSSSNNNVATINNNGVITLQGVGTCNIIASFAGNDTYESKEVSFKLNVTERRLNVFVGAGPDYNSVNFTDTGEPLSNNMIVDISLNDEDYYFIKVGRTETINSFATYMEQSSPFNFNIPLDSPVNIDSNYKYYKSTNKYRQSTGKYIINKTN